MLNPKQAALLKRRVNRLIKAEIELSWKGAQTGAAITMIEAEAIRARQMFDKLINTLTVCGS